MTCLVHVRVRSEMWFEWIFCSEWSSLLSPSLSLSFLLNSTPFLHFYFTLMRSCVLHSVAVEHMFSLARSVFTPPYSHVEQACQNDVVQAFSKLLLTCKSNLWSAFLCDILTLGLWPEFYNINSKLCRDCTSCISGMDLNFLTQFSPIGMRAQTHFFWCLLCYKPCPQTFKIAAYRPDITGIYQYEWDLSELPAETAIFWGPESQYD